ncbi:hypothetical protein EKN06_00925 [Croceicoccus ponticola]|uniref:WD40 repeat domain-containing protein n=1 Tax=Croceicoccus ponticola TaxID=2217664 RepID=A0A437GZM2_9SPHN|nr:hypothetical protein EKN06_00925 [Croceicoccus ponticola]
MPRLTSVRQRLALSALAVGACWTTSVAAQDAGLDDPFAIAGVPTPADNPANDASAPEGGERPAPDGGEPGDEPAPSPVDLPLIDLSLMRTDEFTLLYFDPAQTYLTPYVGRAVANSLAFHEKLFDWKPWDSTTVLLKDFSDYGNAAARSSPNNAVLFDVAPLGLTYETFSPGERFYTLSNHEMAHVATMDVWNSRDAGWRKFFAGKPMPVEEHPETILYNFLTTPRVSTPRWYLEGSAVFLETWMAGGLGRGQGAYDEMVFRAKVRDDARIWSPVALESKGSNSDFQVGVNDYLYGTRFFSYLALTYGPEKVLDWLRRDEASAGFYATQFRRVFGLKLEDGWNDWIAWERKFQSGNLDALAKYPFTPVEPLADRGLGSVSRVFFDERSNSLIGAFRYPGVLPHVGRLSLSTGKIERLADIKGAMLYSVTSLAFDPDTRTAFYTEDNYAYRDVLAIDVDTGKKRMLLRDRRIGDLAFNRQDKSLWGIRHQNGLSTLVRIPAPYAGFNQVATFDYNETPFDLDISPDGTMLSASVGLSNGKQTVRVWQIETLISGGLESGLEGLFDGGVAAPLAQFDMPPATPESFVFAPDGKSLYGTAYYTGVSNVFRYDIATGEIAAVSNASTGFFRPLPLDDGSLIVFDFAGEGFIPTRIAPEARDDLGTIVFLGAEVARLHPEVRDMAAGSPARVDLDAIVTERGKYRPDRERKLAARYPFVAAYKGDAVAGLHFTFEDPLQFKQVTIDLAISPTEDLSLSERLHGEIAFETLNWTARYWHNRVSFYDLFGPVERSRKGDAIELGWRKSVVYDPPRVLELFADLNGYVGLETLPNAQNVAGPSELLSFQAGGHYVNETKSLGAIDHEKGVGAELVVGADYGNDAVFPGIRTGFAIGRPLPIRNSSVWLYTHAGAVGGPAENPLGSVYFGSFRNNYVDDREIKRYREWDSFPGFEIDEIDARRFAKAVAEWNLPPLRFAELGTSSFHLSSLRPAVFAGMLATDSAFGGARTYGTIGGQIDLNMTVSLRLPMTLSLGAAKGIDGGNFRGTEWLVSLKVL